MRTVIIFKEGSTRVIFDTAMLNMSVIYSSSPGGKDQQRGVSFVPFRTILEPCASRPLGGLDPSLVEIGSVHGFSH